MISCDEGNACVIGRGNKVLAEWATLTYAIIRLFTENGEELKEELYRKKEFYEKTLEEKENELKLKMHKNRVLYENKIKKIQQIIERL